MRFAPRDPFQRIFGWGDDQSEIEKSKRVQPVQQSRTVEPVSLVGYRLTEAHWDGDGCPVRSHRGVRLWRI